MLVRAVGIANSDPISLSLRHLSYLFSYIDKDLIACWNGTCDPGVCPNLTAKTVSNILVMLNDSADIVFAEGGGIVNLTDAQRADLLVTWQWIKSRIWLLASLHGLTGPFGPVELSSRYVIEIAVSTVDICNQLSFAAMECHGTGFVSIISLCRGTQQVLTCFQVEKLYDIAHLTATTASNMTTNGSRTYPDLKQQMGGIEAAQILQLYVYRHHRGTMRLGPMLQTAIEEARIACHFVSIA